MTLKLVAVEGMALAIDEAGTTATLAVFTAASTTCFCKDSLGSYKGIYSGNIGVTITNATNGACVQNGLAPLAVLQPTASQTTVDGDLVLRVDDEALTVAVPGLNGGSPCTINVTVYVADAGQSQVTAE